MIGFFTKTFDYMDQFVDRMFKRTSKFMIKSFRIFIFLFFVIFLFMQAKNLTQSSVKKNSILTINLNAFIIESQKSLTPFDLIKDTDSNSIDINELISVIKHAKNDKNITSIVVKTEGLKIGYVQLFDLVNAIEDFKLSKKKVVAYLNQASIKQYTIASVADEIIFNPNGFLDLSGWSSFRFYYKDMFDNFLPLTSA